MADRKVLGIGSYTAMRSPSDNVVVLSAVGALPCFNYEAHLEMRPERIFPPMWNMVFYVTDICLPAIKPFDVSVRINLGNGSEVKNIVVHDATGSIEVPISDPRLPVERTPKNGIDSESYLVYAKLPVAEQNSKPNGCIVVPEGTIVIAIYHKIFGPASKADCDAWLASNCGAASLTKSSALGGEVPWPEVDG